MPLLGGEDEKEKRNSLVGPREEDEHSCGAAFFFFGERRSNGSWAGAFGRPIWWRGVVLAMKVRSFRSCRESGEETALVRLLSPVVLVWAVKTLATCGSNEGKVKF
jgi:hypothetical protein